MVNNTGGLSTSEKLASLNPAQREAGQRELAKQTSSQAAQTISKAKSMTTRGFRGVTTSDVIERETAVVRKAVQLAERTGREPVAVVRTVQRRTQRGQAQIKKQEKKKPAFLSKEFLEKKLERLGELTKQEEIALAKARQEQRRIIKFFPEDRPKATLKVARKIVRLSSKQAVESVMRFGFGVLEIGETLGKLQRREIKIDTKKISAATRFVFAPILTQERGKLIEPTKRLAVGTVSAVTIDPAGTAINFYLFNKALKIIGKVIKGATKFKGSPVSQTLQESAFKKSIPTKLKTQVNNLFKSNKFKKIINPKNIKVLSSIDIVEARALTLPETKALSRTFKVTDTIILDKVPKAKAPIIVTENINIFNKKLLSQLPKRIRQNYRIVRQTIVRRDGSVLFRQTSLGRLIPSPTLRSFLKTSMGKRILKLQARKIQPLAKSQLEKQRRLLRNQQRLENKLKKGLQVKFPKRSNVIKNGKRVWPFKDIKTGKVRYFTSRKLWLRAVKQQAKVKPVTLLQIKRKAIKSAKKKTMPERLQLEKQRRLLRKQAVIEKKLAKGLRVKVSRKDFVIRKGKRVWPFKDIKTGKVRYFTSRKLWLRAVKQQAKLQRIKKINWDIWLKPTPSLEKVLEPKAIKIKKKPIITIFKAPEIKLKPGEKEIKVGRQVLIQKLKPPQRKRLVLIQEQAQKVKTRTQLKTVQLQSIKLKKKLVVELKQATKVESRLKVMAISSALLLLRKANQKAAQKLALITKQIPKLITRQELKTLQKLGVKLTTKQQQILKRKLSLKQKKVIKQKLIKKRKLKLKFDKKKKELEELTNRVISKRKFIYIPDLYSRVFEIKANPKERKAFLRIGRVFTGIEARKLI